VVAQVITMMLSFCGFVVLFFCVLFFFPYNPKEGGKKKNQKTQKQKSSTQNTQKSCKCLATVVANFSLFFPFFSTHFLS
jgi:hypothetical protein